jgi:hypothetical protein
VLLACLWPKALPAHIGLVARTICFVRGTDHARASFTLALALAVRVSLTLATEATFTPALPLQGVRC